MFLYLSQTDAYYFTLPQNSQIFFCYLLNLKVVYPSLAPYEDAYGSIQRSNSGFQILFGFFFFM